MSRRALTKGLQSLADECGRLGTTLWILREVPLQRERPQQRAARAHLTGGKPGSMGVDASAHELVAEANSG